MSVSNPQIKRVLVSVTDKTGLVDFIKPMQDEFGVEVVSTGGTAKVLEAGGIKVRPIDDLTGFPEMMNGRVKTLHPNVHGGLLALRDSVEHMTQAEFHGIEMIDMVVVNLYAFEETVAKEGVTYEEAIENIDIGGPSMLRSAAKNHASVAVVSDPDEYDAVLEEMRENDGATLYYTRQLLALWAFQKTADYDGAITDWLREQVLATVVEEVVELRYGENPHQSASFYADPFASEYSLGNADQIQGKELSFNNLLDLNAAWVAVREFSDPTVVIVKHQTPCGIVSDRNIVSAYRKAHDVDPVSAFGGVMAFNKKVTVKMVRAIYDNKQFVEAIIAPYYSEGAIDLLSEKPNIRVLETGGVDDPYALGVGSVEHRSIDGGVLEQDVDAVAEDFGAFTVPTERRPTDKEMSDLFFAWKACKSVKSNAIVIAKDCVTIGLGAGQPNRVNSAKLAVEQAGEKARGAVGASDAFFPFTDGLEALIEAGVTAVIEPGGSKNDQEVIDLADEHGVALVFTGVRHFRH